MAKHTRGCRIRKYVAVWRQSPRDSAIHGADSAPTVPGENLLLPRQQLSVARRRTAHADEPSPGPQAVRHARNDGNADAFFERRNQLESPESTTGDEHGIRFGRRL